MKDHPRTREIMSCVMDALNEQNRDRAFALADAARAAVEQLEDAASQPHKSYCSECEGTGTVTVATAQCCGRPGDECCGMPIPVPAPEPCPACHGGELLTPPTSRQFNFALGLLDSARQEITPIIGETASLCSAIDDFLRTGEVPSNCEEQASRSEPHKPDSYDRFADEMQDEFERRMAEPPSAGTENG